MPLICLASPNGGVGRTTLAANIARELVSLVGGRIVALDLDPQNTLGLYFGLDLRDVFGFLATLHYTSDGRTAWRAALRATKLGVSYLPHGLVGLEGANAISQALAGDPEILAAPIREMLRIPDVTVVADLPSGPSATLAAILPLTDLLIVPFLVDAVSMSQLPSVESGRFTGGFGQDGRAGIPPDRVSFVFNQLDVRTRLGRATADTAVLHLGTRLLGVVHRDEHVPEAIAAQRLVVDVTPEARASQEIKAVAQAVSARLASRASLGGLTESTKSQAAGAPVGSPLETPPHGAHGVTR